MTLTTIADLNSLGYDGALVMALEIYIPNTDVICIVNNGENITFQSNLYVAFPFNIGELSVDKGQEPSLSIQVDNTTRVIEAYLIAYDNYIKINGVDGNGISAVIRILNTNDLTEAVLTEYFDLISFSTDSHWATFRLGAESVFNKPFPPRKIYQNFCQWKFKSTQCGYSGTETTCNKTLTDCRYRNNSSRFGGFAGIGQGLRI